MNIQLTKLYNNIIAVSEGNMGHTVSYNEDSLPSSINTGSTNYSFTYDALDRQTKRRLVIDPTAGINLDITYAYKDSARGTDHLCMGPSGLFSVFLGCLFND